MAEIGTAPSWITIPINIFYFSTWPIIYIHNQEGVLERVIKPVMQTYDIHKTAPTTHFPNDYLSKLRPSNSYKNSLLNSYVVFAINCKLKTNKLSNIHGISYSYHRRSIKLSNIRIQYSNGYSNEIIQDQKSLIFSNRQPLNLFFKFSSQTNDPPICFPLFYFYSNTFWLQNKPKSLNKQNVSKFLLKVQWTNWRIFWFYGRRS